MNPAICLGHPAIKDIRVPTQRLYDAFLVEGGIAPAAEEFDVDCDAVKQAVRFEQKLGKWTVN